MKSICGRVVHLERVSDVDEGRCRPQQAYGREAQRERRRCEAQGGADQQATSRSTRSDRRPRPAALHHARLHAAQRHGESYASPPPPTQHADPNTSAPADVVVCWKIYSGIVLLSWVQYVHTIHCYTSYKYITRLLYTEQYNTVYSIRAEFFTLKIMDWKLYQTLRSKTVPNILIRLNSFRNKFTLKIYY